MKTGGYGKKTDDDMRHRINFSDEVRSRLLGAASRLENKQCTNLEFMSTVASIQSHYAIRRNWESLPKVQV